MLLGAGGRWWVLLGAGGRWWVLLGAGGCWHCTGASSGCCWVPFCIRASFSSMLLGTGECWQALVAERQVRAEAAAWPPGAPGSSGPASRRGMRCARRGTKLHPPAKVLGCLCSHLLTRVVRPHITLRQGCELRRRLYCCQSSHTAANGCWRGRAYPSPRCPSSSTLQRQHQCSQSHRGCAP